MQANRIQPKRLMIFGMKDHGKDTVAEYLQAEYSMSFAGSSMFACKKFIFEDLRDKYGYKSVNECYEDRNNHRQYWYEAIRDYNKDDRARLGREIYEDNIVYCGVRDREEFEAIKAEGLFDIAVWVDASERKPPESFKSMKLTKDDADYIINNNGAEDQLPAILDDFYNNVVMKSA
jgi:hypothetical protein